MRTTLSLATLIFLIGTAVLGQERSRAHFLLTDISMTAGFETYFNRSALDDFLLNQVSASSHIPTNLNEYQSGFFDYSNGSATFEIMMGFAWRSSEEHGNKAHKRLRIGLSYSQPSIISSSYHLNRKYPFDTLISTQSGSEFYIDSTYSSNLGMSYDISSLNLNTAFLWSTDDKARISFYGGVSLSLALSFSSKVILSRNDFTYLSYEDGYAISYFSPSSQFLHQGHESFRQSSSLGFGFSSPIGMDWRIGRQGKNLNELHLFAEVRPGVNFNNIPDYELISQFRNSWHLGLRFSI